MIKKDNFMAEEQLEKGERKKRGFLANLKRLLLAAALLFVGSLMTLAGLALIQFSSELLLYSGVVLIFLGIIYYLIY